MYLEVKEGHILGCVLAMNPRVYVKELFFMSNHAFQANAMEVPLERKKIEGLTNMPIRVAFGNCEKG